MIVLLLFGLGTGVAAAHSVYQTALVYESELPCTELRSETGHESGATNIYLRGDVQALRDNVFGANCQDDWTRPVNYIRVTYVLQKQSPSNPSSYSNCISYSYVLSPVATDNYRISNYAGVRPCGAGSYRTLTIGAIRNGNTWYGGDLSSLNHLF
ncbi:hypothetical protein ABIB25_004931 [Nakamurella sp. UYEF19]|uniref:hypothetical protein n=1 Tax=Nakamurella sp. UYEF19 TaxID=1756392 RepID=UPI0033916007